MIALDWNILVPVIVVIFAATLVRSTFGFGEALIVVPLLSLYIPIKEAVPLGALLSITVASVVVVQDRDKIHIRSASMLLLYSLFGIPLGLYLLSRVPESMVKLVLAVFILLFSLLYLIFRNRFELKNDKFASVFGFSAGVLGGMYGMNGPILAVYGSFRGWTPQYFRATLQGYFLPASVIGLFGYWISGLWVAQVTQYYLISLPLCILAIYLGRFINSRLDGHAFTSYLHYCLIIMALVLLVQSHEILFG